VELLRGSLLEIARAAAIAAARGPALGAAALLLTESFTPPAQFDFRLQVIAEAGNPAWTYLHPGTSTMTVAAVGANHDFVWAGAFLAPERGPTDDIHVLRFVW
jgi:hypothetical protein